MLSDQIKEAILKSGKTVYQISQETGVTNPVLSRFLSTDPETHRDIRLERTADKLAAYFGLSLLPDSPTAAAKSKVKAPAVPAVDWATAEPETKRKGLPTGKPQPSKPAKGKKR